MPRQLRTFTVIFIFALSVVGLLLVGVLILTQPAGGTGPLRWLPALGLFFIGVGGAGVGIGLHEVFSRLPPLSTQEGTYDEIGGHFLGVVGVIYAVVVAFVVVTAWQQFDHTEEIALQEQRDVNVLFQLAGAYREGRNLHELVDTRRAVLHIRALLRDYAVNMVREWNQMQRGEELCFANVSSENPPVCRRSDGANSSSNTTNYRIQEIGDNIDFLQPKTRRDAAIYEQSIVLFADLLQARDHRRHHYEETLPPILWGSFVIGAMIIIVLIYLLGKPDSKEQLVRTSTLCAMIGIMMALAFVFDHPFKGSMGIDASGWCKIIRHFDFEMGSGERRIEGCYVDDRSRREVAVTYPPK